MMQKYEDSQEYLLEHPHLACEETANYLVLWCIDLEIEEVLYSIVQLFIHTNKDIRKYFTRIFPSTVCTPSSRNCIFSSPEPLGSQGELIGWP